MSDETEGLRLIVFMVESTQKRGKSLLIARTRCLCFDFTTGKDVLVMCLPYVKQPTRYRVAPPY
jgi:hypothetical protein